MDSTNKINLQSNQFAFVKRDDEFNENEGADILADENESDDFDKNNESDLNGPDRNVRNNEPAKISEEKINLSNDRGNQSGPQKNANGKGTQSGPQKNANGKGTQYGPQKYANDRGNQSGSRIVANSRIPNVDIPDQISSEETIRGLKQKINTQNQNLKSKDQIIDMLENEVATLKNEIDRLKKSNEIMTQYQIPTNRSRSLVFGLPQQSQSILSFDQSRFSNVESRPMQLSQPPVFGFDQSRVSNMVNQSAQQPLIIMNRPVQASVVAQSWVPNMENQSLDSKPNSKPDSKSNSFFRKILEQSKETVPSLEEIKEIEQVGLLFRKRLDECEKHDGMKEILHNLEAILQEYNENFKAFQNSRGQESSNIQNKLMDIAKDFEETIINYPVILEEVKGYM